MKNHAKTQKERHTINKNSEKPLKAPKIGYKFVFLCGSVAILAEVVRVILSYLLPLAFSFYLPYFGVVPKAYLFATYRVFTIVTFCGMVEILSGFIARKDHSAAGSLSFVFTLPLVIYGYYLGVTISIWMFGRPIASWHFGLPSLSAVLIQGVSMLPFIVSGFGGSILIMLEK
ncbi:MAG: hypothetical protein GWO20_02325 [Candidatus Korarchaeota archaeon]|nr:hypothetical protein [Candidatus Korarchaeota archaeon]NIU82317.1 hypothetical protein [Candidatus Thorarchaeota archaeon]NIW12800.1 hypothetical protein [Candidatus Thorarchaeota archaeon]NIW51001.1 hypothetical protein [Candidatus Korarchaeota archaeon]